MRSAASPMSDLDLRWVLAALLSGCIEAIIVSLGVRHPFIVPCPAPLAQLPCVMSLHPEGAALVAERVGAHDKLRHLAASPGSPSAVLAVAPAHSSALSAATS